MLNWLEQMTLPLLGGTLGPRFNAACLREVGPLFFPFLMSWFYILYSPTLDKYYASIASDSVQSNLRFILAKP